MLNKFNRKGQFGETMTWVVATIVILIMSFAFVYVSGLMGKTRIGFSSSDLDSGFATQEMAFALLQKQSENGKSVQDLIEAGNYEPARMEAEKILNLFNSSGINCDFYLYPKGKSSAEIGVRKIGNGKRVSVFLKNGDEAVLKC